MVAVEEGFEDAEAAGEGVEFDVFVLGVGLGDVAGAEDEDLVADLAEGGGVADPGGAFGLGVVAGGVVDGGAELADQGAVGVGGEGGGVGVQGVGGVEQFAGGDEGLEQVAGSLVEGVRGFGGYDAAVDPDAGGVGDDVEGDAAFDASEVEGGGAEQGVGVRGGEFGVEGQQAGEEGGEGGVAADAGVGLAAVSGTAFEEDVDPVSAFVGDHGAVAGGFEDDGVVGVQIGLGHQAGGAEGAAFFVGGGDEDELDAAPGEGLDAFGGQGGE